MKKKILQVISFVIVLALVITNMFVGRFDSQTAKALTPAYSVSSSFKSGIYYQRLCDVNLTGDQRQDIANVAKSQLGYTESASSSSLSGSDTGNYNNYTEYNSWYYENSSRHEAWCAIFISWCAHQAGIPTSIIAKNASASPNSFCSTTKSFGSYIPQKGDIAFINSSHVGLVVDVDSSYIYVVEGNSGSSNGVSSVKVRSIRYKISSGVSEFGGATIKKFGVPNYKLGYTVTYDANGGSGAPAGQSCVTSHVISSIIPMRSGYTFIGWTMERNPSSEWCGSYVAGNVISLVDNITLYAQWKENKPSSYTLTYNINGGNSSVPSQTGIGSLTLSSAVPERFGYSFLGWSTSSNATSATYLPSESITLSSNVTLYAVWQVAESAEYWEANAVDVFFVFPGQTYYFKYTPERTIEWSLHFFKFNDDYTTSGDNLCVYLYDSKGNELARAIETGKHDTELIYEYTQGETYYIKVCTLEGMIGGFFIGLSGVSKYKLGYDANGGMGAPPSNKGSGNFVIDYNIPIRAGYNFLGWSTSENATHASYFPGGTITIFSDTTLYAVWEKTVYEITCSDCGAVYDINEGECKACSANREDYNYSVVCPHCEGVFSNISIYNVHSVICFSPSYSEPLTYMCSYCGEVFDNKTAFVSHVTGCSSKTTVTGMSNYCMYCDEEIDSEYEFNNHIQICRQTEKCSVCGKEFLGSAIDTHKVECDDSPKDNVCSFCNRSFDVEDEYNAHILACKGFIRYPSTTTISYGDAIILHVDVQNLPAGATIKWTANNGNFDFDVSSDGKTCRITPSSSGDTTFTATIYDANNKVVSEDTQEMTSKAGFFDKIIAFFKGLFGLTKTIPEMFK